MKSQLWQHLETDITETWESLAVPMGGCSALNFHTTKWQPIFYLGNVSNSDAWYVLFLYQATAHFKTRWDHWDYMVGLSVWYWLQLSLCSQPGNLGDFMECECGSWSAARKSGVRLEGWGLADISSSAGTTLSVLHVRSTVLLQSSVLRKLCQVYFVLCFRNSNLEAY